MKIERREFRYYLQDELTQRCARNPNFSLRSFARHLGVSPSALSAMINGKRPVTHAMKARIGLKLGLSYPELEKLGSSPHRNTRRSTESARHERFLQVTVDHFTVISEPYHYALLELMKVQGFRWEPKWIAKRLKITVSEVNFAIERLERVGLLLKDGVGGWVDMSHGFSTDIREGLSTQAQRKFQQRSLERAIAAVDQVPVERRDNTSMTMAINAEDLPEAKELLKEFRRRFCQQLESNSVRNEVYQLTLSFIPLTGEEK